MFKTKKINAFTLVELVVVITILAILSTVGFVYFADNISGTRDTKRLSDVASISTALKVYKQRKGSFPFPGNSFNILNNTLNVATQGELDRDVRLSTLDNLPQDPKSKMAYTYSVTKSKQEFEVAATLENEEEPKALLSGNYKSVSIDILPSITLAHIGNDIEIHEGTGTGSENRKLFIFDQSKYNLPYEFEDTRIPYSQGVDFSVLLEEAEDNNYWQNSDFTSCLDIYEANKSIGDGEYQYLSGGTLSPYICIMSAF